MYFNAYPSFEPDLGDAVGEAVNGGLEIPTTVTAADTPASVCDKCDLPPPLPLN